MSLVCVEDFEKLAKEIIPKTSLDYYQSGAGDEYTLKLNRKAFNRIRIRPRFLRNISKRTTKCNILNTEIEMPIGISPTAMQRLAHPDGEVANAKAAGKLGCIFILSTISTFSIEEVFTAAPNTHKWFQLYIYKDRSLTESLIQRAEKAGFEAIVLTIDAPIFGTRRSDLKNKFELPSHLCLANFTNQLEKSVRCNEETSGINEYVKNQFDDTLTWVDVDKLVKMTKLPVIVKGILTVEDALLALEYGCKGIIVSNHGARQIDGVPASIEVLPEISKAVGDKMIVMLDGGIRSGSDIFKAMGLGAKMVFIGRPALWGLAVNGQKGLEDLLSVLQKEFETTMALSGCISPKDISKDMIVHESYFSKL